MDIIKSFLSDPFIFSVFILAIVATSVACTLVFMITLREEEKYELPILPELRGTLDYGSIPIEDSGESIDDLLTTNKVVKSIVKRVDYNRRLRILVFSSVVVHNNSERLLKLLQTCSLLNIDIHYVSATRTFPKDFLLEKFLHSKQLRADKILKSKDSIIMEDFEQYDVILHPYSGLKSTYEILVGVIKYYKDAQTKLDELSSKGINPDDYDE